MKRGKYGTVYVRIRNVGTNGNPVSARAKTEKMPEKKKETDWAGTS